MLPPLETRSSYQSKTNPLPALDGDENTVIGILCRESLRDLERLYKRLKLPDQIDKDKMDGLLCKIVGIYNNTFPKNGAFLNYKTFYSPEANTKVAWIYKIVAKSPQTIDAIRDRWRFRANPYVIKREIESESAEGERIRRLYDQKNNGSCNQIYSQISKETSDENGFYHSSHKIKSFIKAIYSSETTTESRNSSEADPAGVEATIVKSDSCKKRGRPRGRYNADAFKNLRRIISGDSIEWVENLKRARPEDGIFTQNGSENPAGIPGNEDEFSSDFFSAS